jgi:hypothetical protein
MSYETTVPSCHGKCAFLKICRDFVEKRYTLSVAAAAAALAKSIRIKDTVEPT